MNELVRDAHLKKQTLDVHQKAGPRCQQLFQGWKSNAILIAAAVAVVATSSRSISSSSSSSRSSSRSSRRSSSGGGKSTCNNAIFFFVRDQGVHPVRREQR